MLRYTTPLLAALLLGLPTFAMAQANPPAPAAPATTQTFTASHLKASEDFLEATGVRPAMAAALKSSAKAQLDANPSLVPFADIMNAFYAKYLSYDAMKPQLTQLYAEHFTEDELNQMTAFYRTPIGQKLAKEQADLTSKGSEMGQKAVADHQDELIEMITKRATELEKDQQKATPAKPAAKPAPKPATKPASKPKTGGKP